MRGNIVQEKRASFWYGPIRKGRVILDYQSEKCVMVIDGALPTGVIANTAAILGVTCLLYTSDAADE